MSNSESIMWYSWYTEIWCCFFPNKGKEYKNPPVWTITISCTIIFCHIFSSNSMLNKKHNILFKTINSVVGRGTDIPNYIRSKLSSILPRLIGETLIKSKRLMNFKTLNSNRNGFTVRFFRNIRKVTLSQYKISIYTL